MEYYTCACAEAAKEKVTVAFRVGGEVFLGLRLAPDTVKPQLHAWALTTAPKAQRRGTRRMCLTICAKLAARM